MGGLVGDPIVTLFFFLMASLTKQNIPNVKNLLHLVTYIDEIVIGRLIPWGPYAAQKQNFQTLVYMCFKRTMSFSGNGAVLSFSGDRYLIFLPAPRFVLCLVQL